MSKLQTLAANERGLTKRLAEAANKTPQHMSKIVHGKRIASLPVALAICDELGGRITPWDVYAARDSAPKAKKRQKSVRAGRR
jgi:transcriptional regulator with XRE-family HTH domain